VTEAKCLYEGHAAGTVSVDQLSDAETPCAFMPYRSKAHLDLGRALTAKGKADVVVDWEGRPVKMIVTAMEPRLITLRRP
jgi:hypothetical protein